MEVYIMEWQEEGREGLHSCQTYQNLILAIEDARKFAKEAGISDVKIIADYKGCSITLRLDGTWSDE
jgi:hypothetical protein